ncbi:IQ domain-containing protein F1 [Pipistrellus kuhlii]|uniref:IQ domain-containing protein F1 n=1 Tax=Pipistrellus kuhlii TaxID=59472 RepID=UPI00174F1858|nr:IQ domain-containing protein F1 [Pipistrellus kuhlii]
MGAEGQEVDQLETMDQRAEDEPQLLWEPPGSPPSPALGETEAEAEAAAVAAAEEVDKAPEKPRELAAPPRRPPPSDPEAVRIQAWWRGILVRRSLLFAALGALTIQRWWKRARLRALEARRRATLEAFTRKEWAAVRLQAWVRMWRTRLRYCRLLHAARIIQAYWRCRACGARGFIKGHYRVSANQLHLELEIVLGSEPCIVSECIPLPVKQ